MWTGQRLTGRPLLDPEGIVRPAEIGPLDSARPGLEAPGSDVHAGPQLFVPAGGRSLTAA